MITSEEVSNIIPKLTWDDLNKVQQGRLDPKSDIKDFDYSEFETKISTIKVWETRTYGFGDFPTFIVIVRFNPEGKYAAVYIRGEYGMAGVLGVFSRSVVHNMEEFNIVLKTSERQVMGKKRLQNNKV
jgi:hypothetical protein